VTCEVLLLLVLLVLLCALSIVILIFVTLAPATIPILAACRHSRQRHPC
jgi:hypothetical protein